MRTCAREENCWRNAAAERLVDPAETARASSMATERAPFSTRNQAQAAPTAPAPITTTSARRGRFVAGMVGGRAPEDVRRGEAAGRAVARRGGENLPGSGATLNDAP